MKRRPAVHLVCEEWTPPRGEVLDRYDVCDSCGRITGEVVTGLDKRQYRIIACFSDECLAGRLAPNAWIWELECPVSRFAAWQLPVTDLRAPFRVTGL